MFVDGHEVIGLAAAVGKAFLEKFIKRLQFLISPVTAIDRAAVDVKSEAGELKSRSKNSRFIEELSSAPVERGLQCANGSHQRTTRQFMTIAVVVCEALVGLQRTKLTLLAVGAAETMVSASAEAGTVAKDHSMASVVAAPVAVLVTVA